jgi:hypothetical protein
MVLPRKSMRDGPVSGSFGGGNGSGKSGTMLYHFVGNSSTDRAIWFLSMNFTFLLRRLVLLT